MSRARVWLAALAAIGAVSAPRAARAELYSWVDDNGDIHFTDVKGGDRRFSKYTSPEAPLSEGAVRFQSYQGDDAEGFGGQPPVVVVMSNGKERTLYPVDVDRYDGVLRAAAKHYNLPFAFLKAIAKVESNFNPRAVSHANAKGIMQLIDETASRMSVEDPFDAEQSVYGGARYLRILANMFGGDMTLTAAAYNAGAERVKRAGGVPKIDETTRYVKRVIAMYQYYSRTES